MYELNNHERRVLNSYTSGEKYPPLIQILMGERKPP